MAHRVLLQYRHSGYMKNKIYIVLIAAIFIASYFSGKYLNNKSEREKQFSEITVIKSACNPVKNICSVSVSDNYITYSLLDSPLALTKFRIEAKPDGFTPDNIRTSFFMRNMNMGKSDYSLVNNGRNIWTQKAILPVCSLGRSDWVNLLEIEYKERVWRIEFYFEQKD